MTSPALKKLQRDAREAMQRLAQIATDEPKRAKEVCQALAEMIVKAPYGGVEQQRFMDLATDAGFTVEYYPPQGVRVHFTPPQFRRAQPNGLPHNHSF